MVALSFCNKHFLPFSPRGMYSNIHATVNNLIGRKKPLYFNLVFYLYYYIVLFLCVYNLKTINTYIHTK